MLLGIIPVTIISSLNCCIFWAVRSARLERSLRGWRWVRPGREMELVQLGRTQTRLQQEMEQVASQRKAMRFVSFKC